MKELSRSARRSSSRSCAHPRASTRVLLAWAAALSLSCFGCARAHHDNVPADDDGDERDERTTRDPVRADDDARDEDEDAAPVGVTPARPMSNPLPGTSVDEPSIVELMADMFAEYQRDGWLRCPCHVATGVYATLEECREASVRQRPTVADCLDESVPPDVLQGLRTWLRCITDAKRAHNACLESAACEEETSCRIDSGRCPFPDTTRLSSVINQCPNAITVGP